MRDLMWRKLRTKHGRERYKLRQISVEPAFVLPVSGLSGPAGKPGRTGTLTCAGIDGCGDLTVGIEVERSFFDAQMRLTSGILNSNIAVKFKKSGTNPPAPGQRRRLSFGRCA